MIVAIDPRSDLPATTIYVGQDRDGHWLVQTSSAPLEGRFLSFTAAMSFARAEQRSIPASVISQAVHPIVPTISFDPVRREERALAHAA